MPESSLCSSSSKGTSAMSGGLLRSGPLAGRQEEEAEPPPLQFSPGGKRKSKGARGKGREGKARWSSRGRERREQSSAPALQQRRLLFSPSSVLAPPAVGLCRERAVAEVAVARWRIRWRPPRKEGGEDERKRGKLGRWLLAVALLPVDGGVVGDADRIGKERKEGFP